MRTYCLLIYNWETRVVYTFRLYLWYFHSFGMKLSCNTTYLMIFIGKADVPCSAQVGRSVCWAHTQAIAPIMRRTLSCKIFTKRLWNHVFFLQAMKYPSLFWVFRVFHWSRSNPCKQIQNVAVLRCPASWERKMCGLISIRDVFKDHDQIVISLTIWLSTA